MALRQVLGITCLALHLLIFCVGIYGIPDHSRELHIKPRGSFWNSTGHISTNFSIATTPSTPAIPTSEDILAPKTTPSNDQPNNRAGTVKSERPRPLHGFDSENNANFLPNGLHPGSRANLTSAGTGSLLSRLNLGHGRSTNRGSSIVSQSISASSIYTDDPRIARPSDKRQSRVPADRRYNSSAQTGSPTYPIASPTPATSAIQITISGSGIGSSKNASGNLGSTTAESGDSLKSAEYLDSMKNRTGNRTRLSPYVGRRPLDVHPAHFKIPEIGSDADAELLAPMPPLAPATKNDSFSSTALNVSLPRTGFSSALTNYLTSANTNNTEGKTFGRVRTNRPSVGLSLSAFNGSTFNQTGRRLGAVSGSQHANNCSGLVTSTAHIVYEVVTSTILVNETITLSQNATTPLPVLITPPPACQTITAPCEGHYCPSSSFPPIGPFPHKHQPPPIETHTPSTTTSTLLVTKKSAAVVQQLSSVGNLFGPTPSAVRADPSSNSLQAPGRNSGSSKSDMSTQSDDSNSSGPDVDGQPPSQSNPQQNPTGHNSQSASSNHQDSDPQEPATGSSGSQSSGNDDQTPSNGNEPDGPASSNAAASNHGDTVSSGKTSGNGNTASNGGASSSGTTNTGGGAQSNEEISNDGVASNDEGAASSGEPSGRGGDISNNGAASKGSTNGDGPGLELGSSDDSSEIRYSSGVVMAGSLPVSIISNAVIVDSNTVKAGSPPTTILVKGQIIAIQPSQIVAQGKTIPIEGAPTPPPANTLTVGNVPVVLRPQDVAIGSKTFEHGSIPTSFVYADQTYSWDASHFVGAGATMTFPSTGSSAPRVTAGGQVFSVFPSQLKVPGKNIPLPSTATTSPFVYKGQTFAVNPSQIIAPDSSITLPPVKRATPFVYIDHTLSVDASQFMARSTTLPLSSGSGIITYNGQILTIRPSKIIGPSTTIALSARDDSAAPPMAVTTGGLTFSIGPSAAVVGSSTYSFVPGKAPATIVTHGEAVLVGSNGVQFRNIHVPIPTMAPSFSAITQGDLAFSIAPSKVVIDDHTDIIHSDMAPITTVVHGHTISIGPKGVGLASTTIPLPAPKPSFSIATKGDFTFSVAPSEVVIKDKTYSIASDKAPITTAVDGQKITIGPKGIRIAGTTVNLPAIETPKSVKVADLTFLIGATNAVISGTTYAVGSGAQLQTVAVGSQSIMIGSDGVIFPSTTIPPEQTTPAAVTADGLTFSIDSTEAVINGTTYAIGRGAVATTLVQNSTTMVLGTDGVALPATTIRPWSDAARTGFSSSVLGTSGASSSSVAATATRALTPIATGREGDEKHGVGALTRSPNICRVLGLILGIMVLGLGLI